MFDESVDRENLIMREIEGSFYLFGFCPFMVPTRESYL